MSRSAAPSFAAPQEPAHGFRSFLDGSLSTGGPVEPREPRQKPSGEKSAKADPAVTTVQVPVVPPPPRPLAFGLGLLDYSGAQALSPDETDLSNGSVSQLDSASLPQAPDSKVDSGKESPAGREAPASDLAFAARLLADQSESPDENTPTNQRGASNSPAAVQRDVASPAAIVTKSATASGDRSADYLAGNASGGQAYVDSIGTPAAPASATQDAPPSAPAQTSNVAPPAQVEPPEPAVQPVSRDLSLHLGDGPHGVDIRMAERAGEIKVTVHTPDRDLADSLRADLPDLVGKLRQTGFQGEVWRPAAGAQADAGRRNGSDAPPSQEHSPGGRREGRQRHPQQQQSKNQSRWAGEWESSQGPAQESHI
ncbi:MAG TPA: hypothetical protein VMR62_16480 [Bryobacteraceae bacterium]|nr:hypothetical protein [Bryobacteraceae bacterium]